MNSVLAKARHSERKHLFLQCPATLVQRAVEGRVLARSVFRRRSYSLVSVVKLECRVRLLPSPAAVGSIQRVCDGNGELCRSVHMCHCDSFSLPIYRVVLDDAQGINPNASSADLSCDFDGVSE